jgi:hypothetical protein
MNKPVTVMSSAFRVSNTRSLKRKPVGTLTVKLWKTSFPPPTASIEENPFLASTAIGEVKVITGVPGSPFCDPTCPVTVVPIVASRNIFGSCAAWPSVTEMFPVVTVAACEAAEPRGTLLRHAGTTCHGGVTQTKSPDEPGAVHERALIATMSVDPGTTVPTKGIASDKGK